MAERPDCCLNGWRKGKQRDRRTLDGFLQKPDRQHPHRAAGAQGHSRQKRLYQRISGAGSGYQDAGSDGRGD
nr:MAG TPA: hypothetical protein [Caudoviricetes sp.]